MSNDRKIPIDGFEKWCLTGKGKKALSTKGLTEEYLKNRPWHAYHAGLTSGQIHLTNPIQDVFNDILRLKGLYLHNHIRKKIEYIMQNKSDYTIEKL